MRVRSPDLFATVRSEGGLLPVDLLARVADARDLPGLETASYGLFGERFGEAITRSWNRLLGAWAAFDDARGNLRADDAGGALTRDRWLAVLLEELRFGRPGRGSTVHADGREFPVYTVWQERMPLHLVGCNVPLDRRTRGVPGAAGQSPHSLVQELLNRSDAFLWGIASNGLQLRLLRDNVSLTRQAFVEFDLEAMFASEAYADFVVLWLVCHATRFEGKRPADCWLERWTHLAAEDGTRALERLRDGVQDAMEILGSGFIAHPANDTLRAALHGGEVSDEALRRYLLRLVYRMLFLFVAEDRDALLVGGDASARARYTRHYSTRRLRELAGRRRGGRHSDLYEQVKVVSGLLFENGFAALALPALGSWLWSPGAVGPLGTAQLDNRSLLDAMLALAYVEQDAIRRPVDFRHMGAEELGSVYEALLELRPRVHLGAQRFELVTAAGSERKSTGSYYTPAGLIGALLDSALEPVLDRAARADEPEAALLALRVMDPACGSGHFLIAAANRIARRLAQVRTGELEPAPDALRHAVRDVIGSCVYGVDVSPMAVELCKVSLWLEALEPGRPLSFLDHRIVAGNSLLGTTPELLAGGVPDEAFKKLLGDNASVVRALKVRNKVEQRQMALEHFAEALESDEDAISRSAAAIGAVDDPREQEHRHAQLLESSEHERARWAADAWCAAFVAPKIEGVVAITQDVVSRAAIGGPAALSAEEREVITAEARSHRFFHWHVAFPDAYAAGGFDAVLGNPPWERVKLQEKEWFATRSPEIATASTKAAREKLIEKLPETDEPLWEAWQAAKRRAEAASFLLRASGRYPLCGRGDVNTYSVFAEAMRGMIGPAGRLGVIVPTGIATDDTTKHFFRDLVSTRSLVSLWGFENEDRVFPGVHHDTKFCLLAIRPPTPNASDPKFAFYARQTADITDEWRRFTLSPGDIALLNPNTGTCPSFRSGQDAEVTKKIYLHVPPLVAEGTAGGDAWGVRYRRMFDMANDSGLFDEDPEHGVPLYEGKMFWHFDHRFGTYEGQTEAQANLGSLPTVGEAQHRDPHYRTRPRYWVANRHVVAATGDGPPWLIAFRGISRGGANRTLICSALAPVAVGHSAPLLGLAARSARERLAFLACANALVADYCVRQKTTGQNLTLFVLKQVPFPTPAMLAEPCPWDRDVSQVDWLSDRALELVYTAHDLDAIAEEDPSLPGPFVWDPARREAIRAELDGALVHLYGLDREDAEHVLDSFAVARKYDEAEHREFRTKRLVLERYDALAAAIDASEPYTTPLDPPPGDPRATHAALAGTPR
ncbi:Eco57I restriction-modification methylase domain-containing protein [Candidatus Solirubrobacter pratensis]|uniref:Eco57I restriction-modification methylase domain-containing protein n=1 Tax=Candidatus Solirubrobacter pratensis TaxID=1298857 RepID=UPI0003F4F07C|nr:N-6 DNA methylase [Candidatus Solirubrobacter pratensis]